MSRRPIKGMNELLAKLARIAGGARSIAGSAMGAALGTMAAAARAASPGTVATEIGVRRVRDSAKVRGKVGLSVGRRIRRAHGQFLVLGTPYIQARRFFRQAITSSIPRARSAARRAAQKRLQKITKG